MRDTPTSAKAILRHTDQKGPTIMHPSAPECFGLPGVFKIKILYLDLILDHIWLRRPETSQKHYKINYILEYKHGFTQRYAKIRPTLTLISFQQH